MVLDSHVHLRDLAESYKETIAHGLYVAKRAGVRGVFAMPNTKPSLTEGYVVKDYLALGDAAKVKGVFFGVYMALTSDREQVKRAIGTYRRLHPRVVGFKIYLGHSTNNIGVTQEEDQRKVIFTLASEGYCGILFAHAEKEKHIRGDLFDYINPPSHALLARPPIAEIESIKDVLSFCKEYGFKGRLHIAHISTPESVELVYQAKLAGQNVSCGVTPHHLWGDLSLMDRANGLHYKVNPPLREANIAKHMMALLKVGKIDWIETDHAPHTLDDKVGQGCASGIEALHAWPLFIRALEAEGFSPEQIVKITHQNIVDAFKIDVPYSSLNGNYHPEEYDKRPWTFLEEMLA